MVYRGLLVAKRTARPIVSQLKDNRSAMAKDEGVPKVQFPGVPIEAGLHGSMPARPNTMQNKEGPP